jgi:PilZ domain-containing protein
MEPDDFTLRTVANRRVATRYVVSIPVWVHFASKRANARIVDISDSGAKLECEELASKAGDNLLLELPWFEDERRASILARYVRKTHTGCGVQFSDPDPFLRLFVKLARLHDDTVSDGLRIASSRF